MLITVSLYFISFLPILWSQGSLSSIKWTDMSQSEFAAQFLPYEQCVLNLNDSTYNYDRNIFQQPACSHLMKQGTVSHQVLHGVSCRCWLGGKQQRQDDGICVGRQNQNTSSSAHRPHHKQHCISLQERKSLWKTWKGLSVQISPTVDFLNTILESKFELLFFIGDSMVIQLAQRLLCNIIRQQIPIQQFGNFFSMPVNGASAKISQIPHPPKQSSSSSSLSTVTNTNKGTEDRAVMLTPYRLQNGMGCTTLKEHQSGAIPNIRSQCELQQQSADQSIQIHSRISTQNMTACIQKAQAQFIYQKTIETFRVGPKWAHTLYLVMLPIRLKFEWEYEPFVQALLSLLPEIQQHNSQLIVLSPFAQHFRSHPLGLYTNFTKPLPNEPICGPISSVQEHHPESLWFLETIQRLDPRWKEKLSFFNSYPHTIPMFDLHSESHSTGWSVDCTHYFFHPSMFDAIWVHLTQHIRQRNNLY
jgi:hypothetical protein